MDAATSIPYLESPASSRYRPSGNLKDDSNPPQTARTTNSTTPVSSPVPQIRPKHSYPRPPKSRETPPILPLPRRPLHVTGSFAQIAGESTFLPHPIAKTPSQVYVQYTIHLPSLMILVRQLESIHPYITLKTGALSTKLSELRRLETSPQIPPLFPPSLFGSRLRSRSQKLLDLFE